MILYRCYLTVKIAFNPETYKKRNGTVMSTENAILIAAVLATLGWLYTGRRARNLARKQHSMNLLLQASFNNDMRNALHELSPHLRACKIPNVESEQDENILKKLRFLLNHYEFVAAGIRNGDLDEELIRDSERGTILTLFECSKDYIESLRNTRRRRAIYEHLEWLHKRWETHPPNPVVRFAERCRGRPFKGRVERVID